MREYFPRRRWCRGRCRISSPMEVPMQRALSPRLWLVALGMVSGLSGCDRARSGDASESGAVPGEAVTVDSIGSETVSRGKVPLTTKSEEARKLYLQGQKYGDQLRFHEARQLYQQAAAKDPDFAMAHLRLAQSSPTPKEFWAHLNQAVALSDKAAEGERLTILVLEANANADPAKALQRAEELVRKYPEDERAHLVLANNYNNRQDYEKTIQELKKAIELEPNFTPAYNSLGYAYRPVGNYGEAEKAFKKYIELVPKDPNPYDSYAELLMKTGRFDESIAQYRKALSIDPHFVASHYGIASDLMFQGKHAQAIAETQKMDAAAQNDGDRRFAMFTRTVVYVDQGKTDQALKEMQKQYDLGAGIGDTAAMAGDAESMGDVLLNAGKPDEARKRYEQALSLQEKSGLSSEVKEDAKLAHHYNLARVALKKNDLATAKSEAAEFQKGAEARKNSFRIRQAHALAGKIALKEKNFDQALSELEQANQQDAGVLYATGLAYQGKGDQAKAAEMFKRAAESYDLPTLSYVFIRAKAKQQAAGPTTT
jgi:tetratricopeptide (TPR) repeat protein